LISTEEFKEGLSVFRRFKPNKDKKKSKFIDLSKAKLCVPIKDCMVPNFPDLHKLMSQTTDFNPWENVPTW
jgi:hypothetical protein